MGDFNSSVTRVWPAFDFLFNKDSTGATWLQPLLELCSIRDAAARISSTQTGALRPHLARFEQALPRNMHKVLGPEGTEKLGCIRNAFEQDLPPSPDFLRWLLQHPQNIQWPKGSDSKDRKFGEGTQQKRKRLLAGDADTRSEALRELDQSGAEGSRRKWWAFEGFTSADCLLETDRLVVIIEGKRTEPVSAATDWFPQRNQIIRNLECARNLASRKKNYAVLICAEQPVPIPGAAWSASLPHMSETERAELRAHFLGFVLWNRIAAELCDQMSLPRTVQEAVNLCLTFR